MFEGRERLAWDHTSYIVAMIKNVNVAKKKDMSKPIEFNPYRSKATRGKAVVVNKDNVGLMRKAFIGR